MFLGSAYCGYRDNSFSGISMIISINTSTSASHLYTLLVGAVVQVEVARGQVLDGDQPGK